MYPSIKLTTIKKVVRLFSKGTTVTTKKTTNLCLELVYFKIISTLIILMESIASTMEEERKNGVIPYA